MITNATFKARLESCEKRLLAAACLSVLSLRPPAPNNSAPTGRIYVKLRIDNFC